MNKPLGNRLSYLEIQQTSPARRGSSTVKPASHCTAPSLEKDPEHTLTTAGSLFALYNKHFGDILNNTPYKLTGDPSNGEIQAATMPRKRKKLGMTPNMSVKTASKQ